MLSMMRQLSPIILTKCLRTTLIFFNLSTKDTPLSTVRGTGLHRSRTHFFFLWLPSRSGCPKYLPTQLCSVIVSCVYFSPQHEELYHNLTELNAITFSYYYFFLYDNFNLPMLTWPIHWYCIFTI